MYILLMYIEGFLLLVKKNKDYKFYVDIVLLLVIEYIIIIIFLSIWIWLKYDCLYFYFLRNIKFLNSLRISFWVY